MRSRRGRTQLPPVTTATTVITVTQNTDNVEENLEDLIELVKRYEEMKGSDLQLDLMQEDWKLDPTGNTLQIHVTQDEKKYHICYGIWLIRGFEANEKRTTVLAIPISHVWGDKTSLAPSAGLPRPWAV